MYAALRARVERERGPLSWLRERPTPQRVGLLVLAGVLVVGGVLLFKGAWPALGPDAATLGLGVLVLLLVLAMAAALRPVGAAHGGTEGQGLVTAGVLLGALGAVAIASDGSWGEVSGLRCWVLGVLVGAPVFSAALLLDRAPWRAGPFGALAAGLAGTLAAQLVCPSPHLGHLVVGHYGVALICLALFGAVAWGVARHARTR